MNSLLQNGLLGMGGIGGITPKPQGLLGNYYDEDAVRKATLKQMLIMGGLGLAGNGWEGAARGAGLAAYETPKQFRDMAMDAYQMDRQSQDDAYRNQQREWEIMDRQNRDVALNSMDPSIRNLYQIDPALGREAYKGQNPNMFPADTSSLRSFAPIPFTRPDGSMGYGIPVEDGSFREVQAPEGTDFLRPFDRAYQTEAGKTTAEQTMSAPGDISAADEALRLVDQIAADPNRAWATGGTSVFNVIPGTSGYDFQNSVNQAKSQAFLSAIEQMRGLGALSNAEGQTATAAVNRMDTATSEEAFMRALTDYRNLLLIGKQRAQQKIRNAPMPVPGAQPQGNGGTTSTGVPWSVE